MAPPTPEEVMGHLERVLASDALSKSGTNRRLLTYLVQRSLQSTDGPKEAEIAMDVFARGATFNGGEDSVVRVSARGLRQKLVEYYAGEGKDDALAFDIPKGGYRLSVSIRERNDPAASAPTLIPTAEPVEDPPSARAVGATSYRARPWKGITLALAALLLFSAVVNVHLWRSRPAADPVRASVQQSLLWKEVVQSTRPLMFVLGDLFMYTQTDPETGRTQTVRDTAINSSEDLRSFLASNPALAADRGLRYATMVQKSAALGMADILPLVAQPGRRIDVRIRDELMAEDLQTHDIIYVGPIARLGPLASHYHVHSRYRFDAGNSAITDVETGKVFKPEGELGAHHMDYALAARFPGPAGNSITLLTSGGRNAGLLQVIRTLTSPGGLRDFDRKLEAAAGPATQSFEALLSVTGFKQTDLGAEVVDLHRLQPGAVNQKPPAGTP
jgi:hypothetical protein